MRPFRDRVRNRTDPASRHTRVEARLQRPIFPYVGGGPPGTRERPVRPGQVLAPPSVSRGVLAPRCVESRSAGGRVGPGSDQGSDQNVNAGARVAPRSAAARVWWATCAVGTLACRCTPLFRRREIRVIFGHRPRYDWEPATPNASGPGLVTSRRSVQRTVRVRPDTLGTRDYAQWRAAPVRVSGIPVPLGTISDAHERPNALGCWPWPFLSQRAPMHAISDRLHSLLDRTPRASPDQRAPRRLGR